jgi:hypothetical protein
LSKESEEVIIKERVEVNSECFVVEELKDNEGEFIEAKKSKYKSILSLYLLPFYSLNLYKITIFKNATNTSSITNKS